MDSLRQIAQQRAVTRRDFLRSVAIAGPASRLLGFAPLRAAALPQGQKTVVVIFGGGSRDKETFALEGQEEYSSADERTNSADGLLRASGVPKTLEVSTSYSLADS
jgi:hypothetical protein